MPRPVKNVFDDPYAHIEADEAPADTAPAVPRPTEIVRRWTDKMTGAEYEVREKAPAGPEGDWRVPDREADRRFRIMMGLEDKPVALTAAQIDDQKHASSHEDEPVERVVTEAEIEAKIRQRALMDARLEQMTMPTTETPDTSADTSAGGLGTEWTQDAAGRIRDLPLNRMGPYGGEAHRDYGPGDTGNLRGRVGGSDSRGIVGRALDQPVGARAPGRPHDPVEHIFSQRDATGIQAMLSAACRNIFGTTVANHIVTRADVIDRRPGREASTVAHAIVESGLIKPWQPQATLNDRPMKPDAVAYKVGARALEGLVAQRLMPEVMEMPHAQRDALTVAIGRTILNVVTPNVPQRAPNQPQTEASARPEASLVKALLLRALDPAVVRALVPPEVLSARLKSDASAVVNAIRPAESTAPEPLRERAGHATLLADARQSTTVAATRATVGDFGRLDPPRTVVSSRPDAAPHGPAATPDMPSRIMGRSFGGMDKPSKAVKSGRDVFNNAVDDDDAFQPELNMTRGLGFFQHH